MTPAHSDHLDREVGGATASGDAPPTIRPGTAPLLLGDAGTPVAAFDFDGTLVRGDSLAQFLLRLHGHRRLAGLVARSSPAMTEGYRQAGRDGAKAALLLRAVAGLDAEYVQAEGVAYGAALARRIRPAMAERLAWHGAQGHRRVLVSASLAVYLDPFGHRAGFDAVLATRLQIDASGRLTGRLEGPNVRAAQKASLLAAALGPDRPELWAYGDSTGDREMLAMADHAVRVDHRGRPRGGQAPSPRAPGLPR